MLKSFPKILTIVFLTVFILQIIVLFFLLAAPTAGQAIEFTPQVKGLNYNFDPADKTTGNIAELVKAIYRYAIGIVGILAAVVLMIGGVLWVVAGGNATQIGEAKAWIGASLTGLILALTSYLILYTVNPALVDLQKSTIPGVGKAPTGGCCRIPGLPEPTYENASSKDECTNVKKGDLFTEGKECPTACCAWGYKYVQEVQSSVFGENCKVESLTERGCQDLAGAGARKQYKPGGKCKTSKMYSVELKHCE